VENRKGAIILRVDGTSEFIPLAKRPTLQQQQEWVGGWIAYVKGRRDGKIHTMVVDDEGILKGKEYNDVASLYYGRMYPASKVALFGDVVVLVGYR